MVMTLALDCGAVVVPAKSDEHDAAAAAISHLPHLLAEALAVIAGEVPLAFAVGRWVVPRRHPGGSHRPGPGAGDVREPTLDQLLPAADRVIELLSRARESLACHNSVAELIEAGHAARTRYDSFPRSDDRPRGHRRGELARGTGCRRTGGRGDQIRSANPG